MDLNFSVFFCFAAFHPSFGCAGEFEAHAQGNEDLTLRWFSHINYTEPLPPQVQCCLKEGQFLASTGVAMIEHQGTANIQGEENYEKFCISWF